MRLGLGTRRGLRLVVVSAGLVVGAAVSLAQGSVKLMEPEAPLLPAKFGEWTRVDAAAGAQAADASAPAVLGVNPVALGECGELRSKVADYTRGGRRVHLEAVQFGDRTGAYSAFTLVERPGMRLSGELGTYEAVGGDAALFMVGKSVVLAEFAVCAGAGGLCGGGRCASGCVVELEDGAGGGDGEV